MIGELLGIGVVLWLLGGALDPEPTTTTASASSAARASVAPRSGSSSAMPAPQPAGPALPPRPGPPPLRGHDAVDPCTAGWDPAIFGVAPGSELDGIFQGAVCCHGLRAVNELGCRSAPLGPDKTSWIDPTSSPRAVCSAAW